MNNNTKQQYTALETRPYGTITSRLTSPLLSVLPTRCRNEENKLCFEFQYKLTFDQETDYTLLWFDFASQELVYSALLAQSYHGGAMGSDPFMKTMIEGNKEDGTDLYSLVANSIGIKRNQAKGAVLATMYGCGQKLFTQELLKSIDSETEKARVKPLAKIAFNKMKGQKDEANNFSGGIASNFFNWSAQNANRGRPILPLFGQYYPKALSSAYLPTVSPTSSINYAVQAGCAINGMLSLYLVAVTNQFNKAGLTKLDARYSASVHDMVCFIVKKENVESAFVCMIKAYLQSWALVCQQFNLQDIPTKFIYDFEVDVSDCLRKEAFSTIKTPLFEYTKPGYKLKINKLTGNMEKITE
jgi:hypothetical protein